MYGHNQGFPKKVNSQPLLMFLSSDETLIMHFDLTMVRFIGFSTGIKIVQGLRKQAEICEAWI